MLFSAALPAVFLLFSALFVAANDPNDPDDDIRNFNNVRYTAALTVGEKTINVILDTGSTDLWLNPYDGVGWFEDTGVSHEIRYGEGATFINGTIGLADMSIAGHDIHHQAFINVSQIAGLDACGSGICGLVGLGFDSPTAGIEKALTDGGLDGPKIGKSVLSSIFDMNPDKGRFFALSLSRLGDAKDTAEASLSIAEYDPLYAGVQWLAKRLVYPPTAKSWRLLADGISVNGASVPWPAVSAATPAGHHVVLLDTGTTNILVPAPIRDAIFSAVPGAFLAKNSTLRNSHWSADRDVWVVPCDTPVSFSVTFGGQPYPLHPLDLTDLRTQVGPDGTTYKYCVGSITNGGTITTGGTDALYGDSFLRNVYTVFSFGDNTTATPYVQLMSQTNEWESTQDFAHVRQQQLAASPGTEIHPAELIHLFDGVEVWHDAASTTASSSSPSSTAKLAGNLADVDVAAVLGDATTPSKYVFIIIGLLAANLLIVLVLAVLGVTNLVRGRRSVGPTRVAYMPTRTKDDSLMRSSFEDRPYSDK
ncbi:aspartic peptidase domain-containing protein [Mycena albidolilacea]|uniref:Aspartic peptidase domain-containing protein n=1 Tax=Mycena albidolilacea TaxID=1033008 RepID=A0AAD7AHP1_9AGAR|nr:aspartic peptidase domain-containing protein [Mycena albidolilacea]